MSFERSGNVSNYGTITQTATHSGDTNSATFYYNLTDSIASNIFTINLSVSSLEQTLKQLERSPDPEPIRQQIHLTQQKTNESIKTTTNLLKELGVVARHGTKEQSLQLYRLKNQFQEILERYGLLQKEVNKKVRLSITTQISELRPASGFGAYGQVTSPETPSDIEDQSLLKADRIQKQKQLLEDLEMEKAMMEEREHRVRQLESDIIDINQITKDLALMVREQGEVVDTIEANVERAATEVETGTDQLRKGAEYQRKYRKKLCWLVIILVIIIAIVLILVFVLKDK